MMSQLEEFAPISERFELQITGDICCLGCGRRLLCLCDHHDLDHHHQRVQGHPCENLETAAPRWPLATRQRKKRKTIDEQTVSPN